MNGQPLISDDMVDSYGDDAAEIVKAADYSACPVPGQEKVQRFLVTGVRSLLNHARNGKSHTPDRKTAKDFAWELLIRCPWGLTLIALLWSAAWMYQKGWFDVARDAVTHAMTP